MNEVDVEEEEEHEDGDRDATINRIPAQSVSQQEQ